MPKEFHATSQEELLEESSNQVEVKVAKKGKMREFAPEDDLPAPVDAKRPSEDDYDEEPADDDGGEQQPPQVSQAALNYAQQMGYTQDIAQKMAEAGILDQVIAQQLQQAQMAQMGQFPAPPGYPAPGMPPVPQGYMPQFAPQFPPYSQHQYSQSIAPTPAYAAQYGLPAPVPPVGQQQQQLPTQVDDIDLADLPDVVKQLLAANQQQQQSLAEMQELYGMLYGQQQAVAQQQQAAWLSGKFSQLASDGWADVFGKGNPAPYTPEGIARQQTISATQFYASQGMSQDDAFELAVRSLHGTRQSTKTHQSPRPTSINRPRKTGSESPASGLRELVTRKWRQAERENEGR